jgi:hypothetical protein
MQLEDSLPCLEVWILSRASWIQSTPRLLKALSNINLQPAHTFPKPLSYLLLFALTAVASVSSQCELHDPPTSSSLRDSKNYRRL